MKDLMDYRKFESYEKNKTTEGEIDNWIKNFQAKLEAYSIDSSEDSSVNHYRRCKHFNYLINVTISKLNSLSDDMIKKLEWSNKIKKYRDQFFHSNNKILICNENNKYIDEDYKILGTFCEDSAFIKRRMNDIQSSVYCSNIANNMSSRKDILINVPGNKFTRGGRIINIDNECSIQLLDTIFHPITCNSSVESPSHVEEPVLSDNHVDDEQSEEKLVRQHAHGVSSSTDDNHGLVTTSEEIEPSDGQSSNTLNTVGLPIFGVLGCSFLFYKVRLMI
ncbi:hypothetical protein PVIIG_05544 [Plasmodium vivax India VII]|uniref:PIR Superfamily Protein n=1 Tax=Plasmodium vivax India VII TaxID=1077284 RepID=A0A0J9SI81_PLAVI|nr:hypothetical protein PVIIG_05544 [Plasmodium vivax India VII]